MTGEALIWTLGEEVDEEFGGRDWPTPRLTWTPANHGGPIPRRLFHRMSRMETVVSLLYVKEGRTVILSYNSSFLFFVACRLLDRKMKRVTQHGGCQWRQLAERFC